MSGPSAENPTSERPERSAGSERTERSDRSERLRVAIVGGGVAALETALGLAELAGDRVASTVIAPNADFAYRPLAVREPFAYAPARRYPLERIVADAGAELVTDALEWVDPGARVVHTTSGARIAYDELVLALGAHARPRYEHAITIDDHRLDQAMHGLVQDVEGGYVSRIAFVAAGRMAWPLPLYELALMTAARAYDMDIDLQITIVTPEDGPLAIFGPAACDAVSELLARADVQMMGSAYAEVPSAEEVLVNPGDRHLRVDRVVALPELYGPSIRGIPLGEHGFIRVDTFGRVSEVEHVHAAGDATAFTIKHGGIGAQQADVVAESLAALAGAPIAPAPFAPVIRGMLLTGERPLYLMAHITGGHGFSSEVSDTPLWSPPSKISSRFLAPYLDGLDREEQDAPVR